MTDPEPEYVMGPQRGDVCANCREPLSAAIGWVRHAGVDDRLVCGTCQAKPRRKLTFGGEATQRSGNARKRFP